MAGSTVDGGVAHNGKENDMKGRILDFSVQKGSGEISGDDGYRYTFMGSQWRGGAVPASGTGVDFQIEGTEAVAVYPVVAEGGTSGAKSKIAAGLFALLLGSFGIHKFYLGYIGPGLVFLLVNTVGWVITAFLFGLPNLVLGVIAFIEGIIYLTKTDQEFEQTYVLNKKPWF
jgi:TM2 domain-containing membrane protein YozV